MMVRYAKVLNAAAVLSVLLLTLPALAQEGTEPPQRDPQLEQEIHDRLAEVAPEAVSVFQEATLAMDHDDLTAALAGYELVLALAPGFPDALRRIA